MAGNTGFQIAAELFCTHEVHLFVGSRQTGLPQRFLGRDLFWWLRKTGLLAKTVDSRVGRRLSARDALMAPAGARCGGRVSPWRPAAGASGSTVTLADDTELDVDAVIWACGFEADHSWILLPVRTPDGAIVIAGESRHLRALLPRVALAADAGIGMLGWVEDDAEYIAAQIAAHPARPAGSAAQNEILAAAAHQHAGERDRAAIDRDLVGDERDAAGDSETVPPTIETTPAPGGTHWAPDGTRPHVAETGPPRSEMPRRSRELQ